MHNPDHSVTTRSWARLVLGLLAAMSLVSCAQLSPQLAPWERDVLARPQMMSDPSPAFSAIRSHMYESREAAARVKPAGGGSACGCY